MKRVSASKRQLDLLRGWAAGARRSLLKQTPPGQARSVPRVPGPVAPQGAC